MEKISGILPSSPRVSGVDMKDAAPARAGAGGFGRPEVVATGREARPGLTSIRAGILNQERLDWKSRDLHNAAMAKDLGQKFFGEQASRAPQVLENQNSPSIQAINALAVQSPASRPAGFKTSEIDRVTSSATFGARGAGRNAVDPNAPASFEAVPFSQVAAQAAPSSTADSLAAAGFHSRSFMPFDQRLSIEEAKLNDREANLKIPQPDGLYPPGSFLDVAL